MSGNIDNAYNVQNTLINALDKFDSQSYKENLGGFRSIPNFQRAIAMIEEAQRSLGAAKEEWWEAYMTWFYD